MASVSRVSGITLRVSDMGRSLAFYRDVLHLKLLYGGKDASFSSLQVKDVYLNLELSSEAPRAWGRLILYCEDVDGMHRYLKAKGYGAPEPRDAPWGERFFHLKDPDGHELSFAWPTKGSKPSPTEI